MTGLKGEVPIDATPVQGIGDLKSKLNFNFCFFGIYITFKAKFNLLLVKEEELEVKTEEKKIKPTTGDGRCLKTVQVEGPDIFQSDGNLIFFQVWSFYFF